MSHYAQNGHQTWDGRHPFPADMLIKSCIMHGHHNDIQSEHKGNVLCGGRTMMEARPGYNRRGRHGDTREAGAAPTVDRFTPAGLNCGPTNLYSSDRSDLAESRRLHGRDGDDKERGWARGGWCEGDNNYIYMHTRNPVTVRNQVKAGNGRTRSHAPHFLRYCKSERSWSVTVFLSSSSPIRVKQRCRSLIWSVINSAAAWRIVFSIWTYVALYGITGVPQQKINPLKTRK